jgi:hypothetical protein
MDAEEKYTIITTWVKYGQHIQKVDKQYVRKICECEKSKFEFEKKHYANTRNVHMQIEVVNNQTGEIREFWNSQDNKLNF